MKAVVYDKYGPPEVLKVVEIPRPVPKHNEILVKVLATSVTAGDWRMRKADPFLARLFNGLLKPRRVKILGFEVAGIVESVGKDVKAFKEGDEIFAFCGFRFGGYAEYTCLPENNLIALKPANLSFEEAATVPVGALTALRFLRQVSPKTGTRILIYGASGSVGTFAVQIAKHFGAEVTGVCSTSNVELVKSLGANEVIDYTRQNLSDVKVAFDIVFDAVGKLSRSDRKHLTKPAGKFVSVRQSPRENADDMLTLKKLLEDGHLKPVIDRRYRLDQIAEAHSYVEKFRKRGNVSVVIA